MSKDEYLITDAPLKALTVFAMPMIRQDFYNYISSTGYSLWWNIFFHFKTVTYDILQFDKCDYGESRHAPC